nr:MAG TPA: hypothetical protein [Caudoviricetes sp.]
MLTLAFMPTVSIPKLIFLSSLALRRLGAKVSTEL